ncbi:stage II sporulation protein R [Salimicrobium halophilum]|uniref:Stage II sporulation protein R n=1 Tax=Salimicrobium halophilum TaxID=86666 RepID=A0A1G8SHI3_9BACI|nr:stage II sporulation protein R [Salimicrobium halophilum]SDJ28709.1 stage II sporulation protein R [Salimicrobium halophilum]
MRIILILTLLLSIPITAQAEETLRIRILAHSNEEADQQEKMQVAEAMYPKLKEIMGAGETIGEAREAVDNQLHILNEIVDTQTTRPFTVEFRKDVYFPQKEGYESGEYEAILVTIGDGDGDNWWCLLFPDICLPEEKEVKKESWIAKQWDSFTDWWS